MEPLHYIVIGWVACGFICYLMIRRDGRLDGRWDSGARKAAVIWSVVFPPLPIALLLLLSAAEWWLGD